MERAIQHLVPRIVPSVPFDVQVLNGKETLIKKLPDRLRGYAKWIEAANTKILVLVDRDDDDCRELKLRLDKIAMQAGLRINGIQILNRIVVEELEAWFFGDVPALCKVYPRIPPSLGEQVAYRDPDQISGGTWEALARVLKKHGYHSSALSKINVATEIAVHMDVECNRSRSFRAFRDGLRRLVSGGSDA